ncbi:MAG TPA: GAF domain-containing protein, partial [Longimicrobiales bacterium]|nr:GAF domain-containing protein [Longimicrobiales bacterium]
MRLTAQQSGQLVLYYGPGFRSAAVHDALAAESVEQHELLAGIPESFPDDAPAVLVVDEPLAAAQPDLAAALAALPEFVTVVSACPAADAAAEHSDRLVLPLPDGEPRRMLGTLRMAFHHSAARLAATRADRELARTRAELRQLNRIGMALMTERDPAALLVQILDRACEMTDSDAGSLYLVEHAAEDAGEDVPDVLRFRLTRNDSLPDLPFVEFTLPIDRTSLAGYAAATGEPLALNDAYEIPESAPYKQNRSFDERFGYRTKSMLVVPMADHRGEVVGVLQLINRKNDPAASITSEEAAAQHVLPYTSHELELVQGLAGQAAVSIENSRLYQQIQDIFESFVKAAVTAIDQRDPTTAGHSVRVATLTTDLAEALRH